MDDDALTTRVSELLSQSGPMTARELATALSKFGSVNKSSVNRVLYGAQGKRFRQDAAHRWSLMAPSGVRAAPPRAPAEPTVDSVTSHLRSISRSEQLAWIAAQQQLPSPFALDVLREVAAGHVGRRSCFTQEVRVAAFDAIASIGSRDARLGEHALHLLDSECDRLVQFEWPISDLPARTRSTIRESAWYRSAHPDSSMSPLVHSAGGCLVMLLPGLYYGGLALVSLLAWRLHPILGIVVMVLVWNVLRGIRNARWG